MNMEPICETVRSYRNTLIPVTRVPADGEADALAVFVHGFKAERTEGGRFLTVALQLAKHGFDSIMMDQCGCGESRSLLICTPLTPAWMMWKPASEPF